MANVLSVRKLMFVHGNNNKIELSKNFTECKPRVVLTMLLKYAIFVTLCLYLHPVLMNYNGKRDKNDCPPPPPPPWRMIPSG